MVPNTKNFVFHCQNKRIGTYVRWIGQCLVHGTRPSSSHLWAHQAQGAPGNWNDILGHTKEWIAVVCNKMMKFDGLKLSRMEIVTSGVEAHQACAIVIMSPHGFSGSPYLPGKKSSSFKCVKNAYCGTICALIVDLISYQGLSAPQRRRRRRGRN